MSDAIKNYFRKIYKGGEEPIGGDESSPIEDLEKDEAEINPLTVGERIRLLQDGMKSGKKTTLPQ